MADQPGTFFERQGTSGLVATADAFGTGAALGPPDARATYVDEIVGAGPGAFPSAIAPAPGIRLNILGCALLAPTGTPVGSVVTLEAKTAGNALLGIPDGVAFREIAYMPVPSVGPGVPVSVIGPIPSSAQVVCARSTGAPVYRIVSALPGGITFRALVYVQAIRSGDVPTPC